MNKLFDFLNNVFKFIVEETRISREEHEKNVARKLIDPEIGIHADGPCAIGNKIFFSRRRMNYLWCVCYFLALIFEQYVSKNLKVEHYAVDFNNDDPARRALQLLNWGKTQLTCVTVSMFFKADSNGGRILDDLIKSGVLEKTPSTEVRLKRNGGDSVSRPEEIAGSNFDKIWFILQHQFQWDMPLPVDLPSPDVMQGNSYLTEIETTYALRTNTIWIKAMAFIFLHEYFHILLGHTKLINLTDEEKIEKEWEAETKALEHIRLPENFQNDDFIGVLSLMLCNFFEIVNIEQIVPQDHLPLNERLDKILQHIEFQCGVDLRRVQYFYHFSSIGLIYGLAPLDFDYSNTASSYFDTRDYFNRLYTIVMQKVNSR